MLKFETVGKTSLTDRDGTDYMPRSMKARGIIVLLMMTPNRTRSRLWLQSKLWSDRGSSQAAGSLRTALSDIRSSLGNFDHVLVTDRFGVSLCKKKIEFRLEGAGPFEAANFVEPFEDIDVKDPEFEQLIRDMRSGLEHRLISEHRSRHRPKTVILTDKDLCGHPASKLGVEQLFMKLENRLRGHDEIEIVHLGNDDIEVSLIRDKFRKSTQVLKVSLQGSVMGGKLFIGAEVSNLPERKSMWTRCVSLSAEDYRPDNTVKLDKLIFDLAEELQEIHCESISVSSNSTSALALGFEAKRLLFDLSKGKLSKADVALQMAYEMHPSGDFLAWRALLRIIGQHQHCGVAYLQDCSSVAELLQEAMLERSRSATVTAILSQATYIDGLDFGTPSTLATKAVEDDPTDPFGFAFLSNSLLANGQPEKAYTAAKRAVTLSEGALSQYYFEHFACMAATSLSRYEEAYSHANMAASLKSDFVTSHRWKTALSLGIGDKERFKASLSSLRALEPDFSIAMYAQEHYPTPTLRRLPIMDKISQTIVN